MAKTLIRALIEKLCAGERLALSRTLSKIENRDPDCEKLVAELYNQAAQSHVWGITGPPGAGKSTLVDQLIRNLRSNGKTVAVLAVDPSSPFSGGAVLGDRIRMQDHHEDPGVYIRSLGTRGKQGGLSRAAREFVITLRAAKFDVILVETAGVGQTELDILKLVQSVVVLLVPESGDSIQMMKAGMMEIAHLFVVNKSDRPGADKVIKSINNMLSLVSNKNSEADSWKIPTLKTEAVKGAGVKDLVIALMAHYEYLKSSGKLKSLERQFIENEVLDIIQERIQNRLLYELKTQKSKLIIEDIVAKKTDPYSAADKIYPIK